MIIQTNEMAETSEVALVQPMMMSAMSVSNDPQPYASEVMSYSSDVFNPQGLIGAPDGNPHSMFASNCFVVKFPYPVIPNNTTFLQVFVSDIDFSVIYVQEADIYVSDQPLGCDDEGWVFAHYATGRGWRYNVFFNGPSWQYAGSTTQRFQYLRLRSYQTISIDSISFYGGAYYIERFATSTVYCSINVQNPTLSGDMLMQVPTVVPIYAEPSSSSAILGMTTVASSFNTLAKNYDSDWYIGRVLRDDNVRIEGWLQGTTLDLQSCNNLGGMPLYQQGEITPVASVDCASVDQSNIAQILSPYNVQVADISNWQGAELVELCKAVTKTAQALYKLVIDADGGTIYDDSAHAFRIIMADNPNSTNDFIVFEQNYQTTGANNTPIPSVNCITQKNLDTTGRSASVNCGQNSGVNGIIPEYTFVHELGHVFIRRSQMMGGTGAHPCAYTGFASLSFNSCVEKPIDDENDDDGSFGNGNKFVWGARSQNFSLTDVQNRINILTENKIPVTIQSANQLGGGYDTADSRCPSADLNTQPLGRSCNPQYDWLRGNRGWGSAAPQFGPCSSAAPANFVPTSFQQNPCVFVTWLQTDTGSDAVTEIEETSADLLLNWVYRQQTSPSGFANAKWADWVNSDCTSENGCPDSDITGFYPSSIGPGNDRYAWMNQILTNFVTYYGW
jgi:hypothetical protein